LAKSSSEAQWSAQLEQWPGYLAAASAGLRDLTVTAAGGRALTAAEGFARWIEITRDGQARHQHLYFIGNGASAMMASHFAADACKNGALSAMAFNDAALLTATANDVAFEEVFALPLRRLARSGDLLIAISSSGSSPNILRAVDAARSMSMRVVTLTGMRADNGVRTLGDLNFYVPCSRYGWVECAHQLILHYWLDQYLNLHADGAL
jgi:D-sedoheptulose 7-phosphate isomerase